MSSASERPLAGTAQLRSPTLLLGFVVFEILCQISLLSSAVAGARVIVRTAAFAASLMLVLFLRGPAQRHPSWRAAVAAALIMVVSIFHPDTNTVAAGIATLLLDFSILGPIFWVPQIRIDPGLVRKVILLLWAFHTASALVGALQMYFPGRFEPAAASVYSDETLSALQITLSNGIRVPRPMGLTDTPGGAGIGAAYSILLATGLLLDRPRLWSLIALLGGTGVACFTLYLCQVRSLLVMVVVGLLAMAYAQFLRKRVGRFALIGVALAGVALFAFSLAVSVGGEAVTGRLSTLVASNPGDVYFTNRGIFLEHTFLDLLPQYPLGAGVGRWGMMLAYFGDTSSSASRPIWAEIQWTGWLLDGGVPLMLAQGTALFLALLEIRRQLVRRDGANLALQGWATALLGYSVGAVALTLNACPFAGTMGLDFWVLNATLFAASRQVS